MALEYRRYSILSLVYGIALLWTTPVWEAASIVTRYCMQPPIINNSIAPNVRRVAAGGYVNYTCKENFYAFGITTAMCIVKNHQKMKWIGPDMICEEMCGKPPGSAKAYPVNSTKDRYPPYKVIEYRCKYGRLILGSATTVCRNGKWKAASFFCIKQCGRPPLVKDTKILTSYPSQKNFREKSTVSYTCNEGFHQTGINKAWCFRGKWRGPYINCTVSREKLNEMCGAPPDIKNGQARIVDEPFRHVTYSCADGMTLIGKKTLYCSPSGLWDTAIPRCQLKPNFCGKPPTIMEARHNASFDRPAFPDGSALLYSCIPGYFHIGDTIAVCEGSTARWNKLTIKCKPMHCSPPGEISGGRIEGNKFTYMSKIFFHCDVGHKLIGQKYRVCQEDGHWDGPMSSCQREMCPVLEKPENGGKFGSNRYNDVTKYVCYSGYKLVGDTERRCTENLTWTGQEPKCVPFQCRTLRAPPNGHLKVEYSVNSLANYSCDAGYQLQGPESRRCREDESWTGSEPKCVDVGCKAPEPLWLGTITGSSYKAGSIIFFKCNYDTTFEGKITSSVCINSRWSAETPKCYAKCIVPDIRGLKIFQQDFLNLIKLKPYDAIEHRMNIKYFCEPGYRPSVPKSLWCLNGTWSLDIKCTEDNSTLCERPLEPINGYLSFEKEPDPTGIEPGNYVIYSCKPGYSLHGSKKVRCGENGRWEGKSPRCIFFYPGSKKCATMGVVRNGYRDVSDYSYGLNTTVKFWCEPGYTLVGSSQIRCLPNFIWSNPMPRCESVLIK
ncbi:sushi, von Willebrand factor type A, EGF and pentraxin domain-containing protein 1-like [Argonauta hians]